MRNISSLILEVLSQINPGIHARKFKEFEIWLKIYGNDGKFQGSLSIEDHDDREFTLFPHTNSLNDSCIHQFQASNLFNTLL